MDEIYEHFIKLSSKVIEVQKSLNIYGEHFHINNNHTITLQSSLPYVNNKKQEHILDWIRVINLESNMYKEYFTDILNSLLIFTELLNEKDIKPDDRDDMLKYIQFEIEMLDEHIHKIETIMTSEKLKNLQNDRRTIEIELHTLAAYSRRYKYNEEKINELANKFIDSTFKMLEKFQVHFFERDGPVILMSNLMHEKKSRFYELNLLLNNVGKNLIERIPK